MKKVVTFLRVAIRCLCLSPEWELVVLFIEFDDVYIGWAQNLIAKHLKK